jgi:hypothetical protein
MRPAGRPTAGGEFGKAHLAVSNDPIRGIHLGELPASTSVTLLLETLIGGAMMHALAVPAARRPELASTTGARTARLVEFLLHAVATPADTGAAPVPEPYRPASR